MPATIWQNFRKEVQAADLPPEVLASLRDALPSLPKTITPDALKEQFPAARPLIELAAARGGTNWLAVLSVVLSTVLIVFFGVLAHDDAEEALRLAREAQTQQASKLTNQDIAKIIAAVESDLKTKAEHEQRPRDDGEDTHH